jgi:hypothetical protein
MKLKISSSVRDYTKLYKTFKKVNGKARVHTYEWTDLICLVAKAERCMERVGLPVSHWQGAIIRARSGSKVPASYRYRRRATFVILRRGKRDWFLVCAEPREIYPNNGEYFKIELTHDQYRRVHENLDKTYSIAPLP